MTLKNPYRAGAWLLAGALLVPALAGCGAATEPQAAAVAFSTAETSKEPVTIEGIPDTMSLRQETGKPTEFDVTEESSARKLKVVAAPEVAVPSNFTSAKYVTVTGTYDPAERVFRATQIQTRVPTREQQPRG